MTHDELIAEKIHNRLRQIGGDPIATNIVRAARHAGLQISLACALAEHESSFRNVFGHDPTIFIGAGRVTQAKYRLYKARRGHTRMQGVGYTQLTWYEYQDEADRLGGCWKPYPNLLVGYRALATNIHTYGEHEGLRRYNGSGPAAEQYARVVMQLAGEWHKRLT